MFPNISEYSTDKIANYESTLTYFYPDFLQYGYPLLISEKILGMFAFGAVSAIPAFFLTGFMKINIYNLHTVFCEIRTYAIQWKYFRHKHSQIMKIRTQNY